MALTDNPGTLEVRQEPRSSHQEGRRGRSGGDYGGRRPSVRPFKVSLNLGPEIEWLRKTAGKGRISAFVSSLLRAAKALELSFDDFRRIERDPARFRDALRREMDKEE